MRSACSLPRPSITTKTAQTGMKRLHCVFFLPLLAGSAFAQISFPNCTVDYEWSYNSLNQNPCNVASYLGSTCYGEFGISPISSPAMYPGPLSDKNTSLPLCLCNTVVYSLISACGGCQGTTWISYASTQLAKAHAKDVWPGGLSGQPVVLPSINLLYIRAQFQMRHAFPTGHILTLLCVSPFVLSSAEDDLFPQMAQLTNSWNATAALIAGDPPENTAGVPSTDVTSAGASSTGATKTLVSSAGASSTVSQSPSSSPSLNRNKSHSGKIAGAVVGVVLGVSLLIWAIFWYFRRRRSPAGVQPARSSDGAARIAGAFGLPDPNHSMAIGRYYDPSDPNTFPSLPVLPSMSGVQTMHNRGNDGSTDSINWPQYGGLPLV